MVYDSNSVESLQTRLYIISKIGTTALQRARSEKPSKNKRATSELLMEYVQRKKREKEEAEEAKREEMELKKEREELLERSNKFRNSFENIVNGIYWEIGKRVIPVEENNNPRNPYEAKPKQLKSAKDVIEKEIAKRKYGLRDLVEEKSIKELKEEKVTEYKQKAAGEIDRIIQNTMVTSRNTINDHPYNVTALMYQKKLKEALVTGHQRQSNNVYRNGYLELLKDVSVQYDGAARKGMKAAIREIEEKNKLDSILIKTKTQRKDVEVLLDKEKVRAAVKEDLARKLEGIANTPITESYNETQRKADLDSHIGEVKTLKNSSRLEIKLAAEEVILKINREEPKKKTLGDRWRGFKKAISRIANYEVIPAKYY